MQSPDRIVLVRNKESSRARNVGKNVIQRLDDAGITYDTFTTKYADTEANIADMRDAFRDGDTILSAGGDGTGMQATNAILRDELRNVRVGFLGYGNFRDLGKTQDPLALLDETAHEEILHPMTVLVNDEYWRDAPGYLTAGFTARAAHRFGSKESRDRMKSLPEGLKLLASLGQLGADYFDMRGEYLAPHRTSQSPIAQRAVTDMLMINSRQVGRIIKSKQDYGAGDTFGYRTNDVSHILPNIPFGLAALSGRAPADAINELLVEFEEPSTVPIQTEGEFAELSDVKSIFVYKDPSRVLRVLREGK